MEVLPKRRFTVIALVYSAFCLQERDRFELFYVAMDRAQIKEVADIVVRVVAILASAYVAYDVAAKSNPRPSLTIKVLPTSQFLGNLKHDSVKLIFSNRELTNAQLTQCSIENSGDRSVKEEDFFDPISIVAEPPCRLVGIVKSPSWPAPFQYEFFETNSIFTLKPLKLNPGDGFNFLVLSEGAVSTKLAWAGRIAGKSPIRVSRDAVQLRYVPEKWFSPSAYLPPPFDLYVHLSGLEVF